MFKLDWEKHFAKYVYETGSTEENHEKEVNKKEDDNANEAEKENQSKVKRC